MAHTAVVLVAVPTQQEIVQALCTRTEIAAVFNPTLRPIADLPVPVFADWASLEEYATPDVCCFLTPYAALKKDLLRCIDKRINVLSAGPIGLTLNEIETISKTARDRELALHFGGPYPFSPLFQQLKEQRQRPEFGQPVYLRLVQGKGSGLQTAWWTLCDALNQACELLDSELQEAYVSAVKQNGKYHLSLTGATANRANIQLAIAPLALSLYPDITLLGSGGLLTNRSVSSAPLLMGRDGLEFHLHPNYHPEPAWLGDFLNKINSANAPDLDWPVLNLHHQILRGARLSMRQKAPVHIKLQP